MLEKLAPHNFGNHAGQLLLLHWQHALCQGVERGFDEGSDDLLVNFQMLNEGGIVVLEL